MTKPMSKKNLHKERLRLRKLVTSYAKLLERNSADPKVPSCLNDWLKSCTIPVNTLSSSKKNKVVKLTNSQLTLKHFLHFVKSNKTNSLMVFLNIDTLRDLLKLSKSDVIQMVAFAVDTTLLEQKPEGSHVIPLQQVQVRISKPSQSP